MPGIGSNLIPQLHQLDRQPPGQRRQLRLEIFIRLLRAELQNGYALELPHQLGKQSAIIRRVFIHLGKNAAQTRTILMRHRLHQVDEMMRWHRAQQTGYFGGAHLALPESDRLIKQA